MFQLYFEGGVRRPSNQEVLKTLQMLRNELGISHV